MARRCKKCGQESNDESLFCSSCGGKMIDKEEPPVEIVKKKKTYLYAILIIALIVILVVPFPYKAIEAYDIQEPYSAIENYYEKEPYTDKVCHYETMIYKIEYFTGNSDCIKYKCESYNQECSRYESFCEKTESICVETNLWGNCIEYRDRCISYGKQCVNYKSVCANNLCIKYREFCELKIENKEKQVARLSLSLRSIINDETEEVRKQPVTIQPLDSKIINWDFIYVTEPATCTYYVSSKPKKQVCENIIKYRNVGKSRTITKYRTVIKEREVMKKDTLFNMWIGNTKYYYEV